MANFQFPFEFLPARFVFEDAPKAAAGENAESGEKPGAEKLGTLAADVRARQLQKPQEERRALQEEVAETGGEADEQAAETKEPIDESGEAIEYVQTLQENPTEFQTMAAIIEGGSLLEIINYQEWPNIEPSKIGALFDKHPDFPVPRGPGREAFIARLKAGPPDPNDKSPAADKQRTDYENSRKTLVQIVALLDTYFEEKRKTQADVEQQVNKPPFNETMGNLIRNGYKSFQQGSVLEKGAIIGALITGYILLKEWWNTKFVQDHKKGIKLLGTGIFTGFVLTKAVHPTKSGPLELLGKHGGIGYLRSINDIKSKEVQQFSRDWGFEEPKQVGIVLLLQKVPVRTLFDEYMRASRPGEKHEIDPVALGFDEHTIDPKDAYDVIEGMVKVTGINAGIEKKKAEAKKKKARYTGCDDTELAEWTSDAYARKAFREKYIDSELGRRQPTLLSAIFNEYQSTDLAYAIKQAKNLPQFAARTAVKALASNQKKAPSTQPNLPSPPSNKPGKALGESPFLTEV